MREFMKWLARWGAVGGTARWAARGYRFFRQRHPDHAEFPDAGIFRLMIVTRYETMPNRRNESYLLEKADTVQGLLGLVVEILNVEASLGANEPSAIIISMEIVAEELERAG